MVEVQGDVLFRPNHGFFLGIAKLLVGSRGGLGLVLEFLHDLADVGIKAASDAALGPDPDLAGTVAAQHRAVLEERHLAAHARGRDGRSHAGVAAAYHHQVELAFHGGLGGEPEFFEAPCGEAGVIGRGGGAFLGEIEGIAAAIESGEIVKRDFERVGGGFKRTAILPVPIGAFRAEGGGQRFAVHEHLKLTGSARRFPAGNPVLGPDPDTVLARCRQLHGGGGVFDRGPEAMGHQVRRAHD